MGYQLSKSIKIKLDASTVICPQDFSMDTNLDVIEIACMNSSAKTYIPDLESWSGSFSLTVSDTSTKGAFLNYEDIIAKLQAGVDVSIAYQPDSAQNAYYVGNGLITSVSLSGGVGAAVTASVDWVGTNSFSRKTGA